MKFEQVRESIKSAWGIERDDATVISQNVPENEIFCQLAEECSELAQAALKLRRTTIKTNPTPQTYDMAFANLVEETADVLACLELIFGNEEEVKNDIEHLKLWKLKRWADRVSKLDKK